MAVFNFPLSRYDFLESVALRGLKSEGKAGGVEVYHQYVYIMRVCVYIYIYMYTILYLTSVYNYPPLPLTDDPGSFNELHTHV